MGAAVATAALECSSMLFGARPAVRPSHFKRSRSQMASLDTEVRGLLPFYAILVQLDTFTILRQNALTFTLPPPYANKARADCILIMILGGGFFCIACLL